MNEQTRRLLSVITLLAWGGILLYFHSSGRIASFLHPMFRPLVLITGVALLCLAAGYWWATRKPAKGGCCDHDHEHGHDHGEDRDHADCGHEHPGESTLGRAIAFLVLLAPLLTAATFSPDEFGRSVIYNRGVIMDAEMFRGVQPRRGTEQYLPLPGEGMDGLGAWEDPSVSDYLPRSPDGHILAEVIDLIFGTQDAVIREDFEGKTVEVIGQMLPAKENNPRGTRFKMVRLFMVCCAADARPVAVLVENRPGAEIVEMGWVKIVGTATFPMEGGKRLVVVDAAEVTPSERPAETMLY